jgi:hypothetical protein
MRFHSLPWIGRNEDRPPRLTVPRVIAIVSLIIAVASAKEDACARLLERACACWKANRYVR